MAMMGCGVVRGKALNSVIRIQLCGRNKPCIFKKKSESPATS